MQRQIHRLLLVSLLAGFVVSFIINHGMAEKATVAAHGSKNQTTLSSQLQYVYFSGWKGKLLKLNKEKQSVVNLLILSKIEGIDKLLPPYSENPFDAWSAESMYFDQHMGRLYGLYPRSIESDVITGYQVIVLQPPLMQVIAKILIPDKNVTQPRILLTADGKKLYINYRQISSEKKYYTDFIEIYDTVTFGKIKTYSLSNEIKTAITGDEPSLILSEKAFILPGEDAIYDLDARFIKKIDLVGEDAVLEKLNPFQMLSDKQKALLRSFEYTNKLTQKNIYSYGIVDLKASMVLIRLTDESKKRKAMFSINLKTKKITPVIEVPSQATSQLTPDGKHVLLERTESEIKKEKISGIEVDVVKNTRKTGELLFFDLMSGKLIRKFSKKEELAGTKETHQILCIAPDSSMFFYAADSKLFAFNLRENKTPKKIDVDFSVGSGTLCVFANR